MPSRGHIHGLFASHLTDAFAACGRGYGLTFPGYTSNPLTLFGPWLRIDYLFAGRGFKPIYCNTERERKSQHRAVAARFEMAE
jgi:vancomycin resistance protein VanJ